MEIKKLQHQIDLLPGSTRICLSGDIDENSDLRELSERVSGPVVLDLAEVSRINSCGVREWLYFVETFGGRGDAVALERCPVSFVRLLNTIANFRGRAEVRSVFAPYFCSQCECTHRQLLDLREVPVTGPMEALECPVCGGSMEFDDVLDDYLSFMDV